MSIDKPELPVTEWTPLPARAALLFKLHALWPAIALAIPAVIVFMTTDTTGHWLSPALLGLGLLVAGLLWFRGGRIYKRFRWRVDLQGVGIRRGNWWTSEAAMPLQRVQHLRLSRSPLQRMRKLATLKIHTAGTRHSSVTLPHIDAEMAEAIRQWLSERIESVDE